VLAEGGRILPVHLSLFTEIVKRREWVEPTLGAIPPMVDIVGAYLEDSFAGTFALPEYRLHRKPACAVLRSLLPSPGRACGEGGRAYEDLVAISGYESDRNRFESLMRILTDELRIVSQTPTGLTGIDSREPGSENPRYRLAHDYLTEPLSNWLSTQEAGQGVKPPLVPAEPRINEQVKRINVNTASERELRTLPGIGPTIVRRLIESRPFSAVSDLLNVKGVGQRNLKGILPFIEVW
jgi:hypothetical protein